MRIIIEKLLILFCISLLIPITGFCQNTLDSIEIKELAIICAENQKLNNENPLLKEQIKSLQKLNNLYVESDSLRKVETDLYKNELNRSLKNIEKIKKSRRNIIIGSSIGGIVLFIIGLLI